MTRSLPIPLCWCFSSLGCPEQNLSEIIEICRTNEIRHLELRTIGGRLDLANYLEETFGEPKKMIEILNAAGIHLTALDSSARIIGTQPQHKAEVLTLAEWAEGMSVPAIRVFDGGKMHAELPTEYLEQAIEFLDWWGAVKAEKGWSVDLIIETHDSLFTGELCQKLVQSYTGDVFFLWDSFHTWNKGGEDPLKTWALIHPHVRHIHIKDGPGPENGVPSKHSMLPGEGKFPLSSLVEKLEEDHFQGPVSLEWERKWEPSLPPLEEALNYLKPFRYRN